MPAPRPFALIRTHDQWLRASHQQTALEGEVVRLHWRDEAPGGEEKPIPGPAAGLAFDGHCRVYHSLPDAGRVERVLWAAQNPLQPSQQSVSVLEVDDKAVLLSAGRNQGIYESAQFVMFEFAAGSLQLDKRIAIAQVTQVAENECWANLTMLGELPVAAGNQVVLVDPTTQPLPVDLFETEINETLGDFVPSGAKPNALNQPRGLAVDEDERLFVAESGAKRILIYDLWSNRLLRQVKFAAEPIDLVAKGRKVYALFAAPPGLVELSARGASRTQPWPVEITAPARLAISPNGDLFVLDQAGTAAARVVKYSDPREDIPVAFATDLDFQIGDPTLARSCTGQNYVLVVARRPGQDFLRFCVGENPAAGLPPLTARGYDGLGIVRVPDGRIGFWSARGFRHAVAARLRYFPKGIVTTFRLDSKEFHTIWGRLFIDACIPKDTELLVRCITADEPPAEVTLPPTPPANTSVGDLNLMGTSPPLPPPSLERLLKSATAQSLHRRETGCELPWVRPAEDDAFETYEAPVLAGPGRYLWVLVELAGNTRATPRLKALRAEYPSHDYLRRLPQTFTRDDGVASFLRRYLATFEGQLGELEAKADARAALLDPRSAPAEILPWLASFLGLMLDERMAYAPRPGGEIEDVRRALIAEAISLFRFRGTVAGLRRFVELYLGFETILIEKFRLRGLGDALLSDSAAPTANSIVGAGYRVGGAIGEDETQLLSGTIAGAFETHAHRFALIIPAALTSEQLDVVNQILELHRPAHTLVEVCTVAAGMRVGRGLHVELTSIVGRSGGFSQLQLGGNATLGRGAIIGRPDAGTTPGGSRLGKDTRVG